MVSSVFNLPNVKILKNWKSWWISGNFANSLKKMKSQNLCNGHGKSLKGQASRRGVWQKEMKRG